MELMQAIKRRRSNSRESVKSEGTPHYRRAHNDPDPPVTDSYDDNESLVSEGFVLPENYDRIKQDYLGKILLNLFNDQIQLARKCNLKGMATNINEICDNFNGYMQINEEQRQLHKDQSHKEMENRLIQKELNSHLLNQAIRPPAYFSPHPVINNSIGRTSDIFKLFPNRNYKFSGQAKDNLSLLEFLNSMNSSQSQAKLSENEFKDMLLACTTGEAHQFLVDCLESSQEDIASTYHQLALRFDTRISPEDAKLGLFQYKAPKDKTLAQVESHIMNLSYRANSIFPAGESRNISHNLDTCNSLIRCLPPTSATLVRKEYSKLSARLGRICTATELSRALNTLRHAVDKDIQQHGVDPQRAYRSRPATKQKANRFHANYSLDLYSSPPTANTSYNTQRVRSPPTRGTRQTLSRHRDNSLTHIPRGTPNASRSGPKRRTPYSGYNKRPATNLNCFLCGQDSHCLPNTCPNMIDNNGALLRLRPTAGTCPQCPGMKKNSLHHPSALCPFRPLGPLYRK